MKVLIRNKIIINGLFPIENFKIDGYIQKTGIYTHDMDDKEFPLYHAGYLTNALYSRVDKREVLYEYFENDDLIEVEISSLCDRDQTSHEIKYKVRKMESGQKKILWSDWLKEYICNRYDNKPVLMLEKEKSLILNWIFELKEVYGEMVEIVCKAKMPSNLGTLFFYRLNESKIVLEYPHETIKLLTKILNDGSELNCSGEEINNICMEAVGLTDEENKNLHEALLKRNIKLE